MPESVTTTPERSVPGWKPSTAPAESCTTPASVPRATRIVTGATHTSCPPSSSSTTTPLTTAVSYPSLIVWTV